MRPYGRGEPAECGEPPLRSKWERGLAYALSPSGDVSNKTPSLCVLTRPEGEGTQIYGLSVGAETDEDNKTLTAFSTFWNTEEFKAGHQLDREWSSTEMRSKDVLAFVQAIRETGIFDYYTVDPPPT